MFNISVLVSGNGSNLQALINAESKLKNWKIISVISDNAKSHALKRANVSGIKTYKLDRKENLSDQILAICKDKTDLIVCAGFLSILEGDLLNDFENRMINIHPSLLPDFGGKGMYGIKVHQAVIKSKVKKSGCSVHYIDGGIDSGKVILQKSVDISIKETAESLQKNVLVLEHLAIVEAVDKLVDIHTYLQNEKLHCLNKGK